MESLVVFAIFLFLASGLLRAVASMNRISAGFGAFAPVALELFAGARRTQRERSGGAVAPPPLDVILRWLSAIRLSNENDGNGIEEMPPKAALRMSVPAD